MAMLTTGCWIDSRPQALRRGLDQVRSVLADPRLHTLAEKAPGATPEERLVGALFSPEARPFWPPPLENQHDFSYKDQSHLPGRIAYLLKPEVPWSVVVTASPQDHRIFLLGYGQSLQRPLLRDAVEVHPDAAAKGVP